MLTEERVEELISEQTGELRADVEALDEKLECLANLAPEIGRLSMSTDSLERSLVEITKANRDALQQLGERTAAVEEANEGLDEAIGALEEDAEAVEGLPPRVDTLETKQGADDDERRDRASSWKTLKIVGAIATVLLLPFLGFLGKAGWDHYGARGEHLVEQSHKVAANGAAIARHEESPGHEPLRERVNDLEGAVVGINTSLKNIQNTQAESRREHTEALQDLQREIRRQR